LRILVRLLFPFQIFCCFSAMAIDCGYSINAIDINIPYQNLEVGQVISVNVEAQRTNLADECRDFHFTITRGGSSDYQRRLEHNGSTIDYNFHKKQNSSIPIKDYPDINTVNNYVTEKFKKNVGSQSFNVYLVRPAVTPGSIFEGGVYVDNVDYKLYAVSNGTSSADTSLVIQVSMLMPVYIDISLVDVGAPFDINDTDQSMDFGSLEQGEAQAFDLKVVSNASYTISFSSSNNGALKHLSGEYFVTYVLTVDGTVKSLAGSNASPVPVAMGNTTTTTGVATHPVSVTIGSVLNKLEGAYSDFITVTATAN
jgi:hypothetical protein